MRSYLDSDGVDALWAKMKTYVANHSSGSSESSGAVVGAIQMYGGSTAPKGWLLCDGSAVSRTEYAKLFAVLGTNYGAGDGSTTFNVPNFSGRFPVGHANVTPSNNSSTSGYNGGNNPYGYDTNTYGNGYYPLGEMGGEAVHTLTTAEMPSHNHGYRLNNKQITSKSGSGITFDRMIWWTSEGIALQLWTQSNGGNAAHTQIPPYCSVNYIIFAG